MQARSVWHLKVIFFGGEAAECVCMSPSKGEPRTARSAFVLDADFLF